MKLWYWQSDQDAEVSQVVDIATLDDLWLFVHNAKAPVLPEGYTPVLELSANHDPDDPRFFVMTWVTTEDGWC